MARLRLLRSHDDELEQYPATIGRGLAASAKRVDPSDKRTRGPRRQPWQEQAWEAYDAIGEVKFGTNFIANVLGKVRLYAAARPEPDQPPVEATDPKSGVPANVAADAERILARLDNAEGGHGELLRALGLNLEVPGEAWLYGVDSQPEQRGLGGELLSEARDEHWSIRSTDELRKVGQEWKLFNEGRQIGSVPDGAFMLRIWNRHPRYSDQADSLLRGVLEPARQLRLLDASITASALSRRSAGLLLIPAELSFGGAVPTAAPDGADAEDPLTAEIMDQLIDPINDPSDPAAQGPLIVRGKAEFLKTEVFRHLTFARDASEVEAEERKECLTRIEQGMNVPPEVIKGKGSTNHWSAAQVTRDEFSNHVEPRVVTICDAFTTGFLRYQLLLIGHDADVVRQVFVWYDESEAVTQPDRGQDAKDAHKALVLSDEALRRALSFGDGDAPDEEELGRRLAMLNGSYDGSLTMALLTLLLPNLQQLMDAAPKAQAPQPAIEAPSTDTTGADEEAPAGEPEPEQEPVTAATGRRERNPGEVLASLDRSLGDRLAVACETAMDRALERAGNKLRSRTQGNAAVKASIGTLPAHQRAATLGRAMVAALGIEDAELIDTDTWDGLRGQFDTWVAITQQQALATVEQAYGELPAEQRRQIELQQAEDRDTAWVWLAAALTALALARLWDPSPSAPELGEADTHLRVPMSTVRAAMSRADGARAAEARRVPGGGEQLWSNAGTEPAGGVATGGTVLDVAEQLGGRVLDWEWQWGSFGVPAHPFDAHRDLDGVQFSDWTDSRLAVRPSDAWLGEGYYSPGDHSGCRCYAVPLFAEFHRGSHRPAT